MKKYIFDFVRRGLIACGLGPLVLVMLYLILQHYLAMETLTVNEVCLGIVSLSFLAFIAGGMNVLYQIEQLPLMTAIFIHGGVLYVSYLATYLINSWLEWSMTSIMVFTAIFILGYIVIWGIIYFTTRRNTEKLNAMLKKNQQNIKEG